MHLEANLTLVLSGACSTKDHRMNKLGRPNIQNVPSLKVISLLVLEKKIFKGVLPYMGMLVILVMCPKQFV